MIDKIITAVIVIVCMVVFFKLVKVGLKVVKFIVTGIVLVGLIMYLFDLGFFAQPKECEDVMLSVINEMPTCYNNDKIFLNFNNSGKSALVGLKVEITGTSNIKVIELEEAFSAESEKLISLDYSVAEYGEPTKLTFTPKIMISEEEAKECSDKSFEMTDLPACNP